MMADLFDNPMGLDGFEFVEFAAPDPTVLENAFRLLGFTEVAKHRSKDVSLWRQGDINFLINEQADSFAARFAAEHGPSCTGFALRVTDAQEAYASTISNGAASMSEVTPVALNAPRIEGIGGSILYLTDRNHGSVWENEYELLEDADPFPEDDWPCDPRPFYPEAQWDAVKLEKKTSVRQVTRVTLESEHIHHRNQDQCA